MLQESICNSVDDLEKNRTKFKSTKWKRNSKKNEGGGEYRILKDGKIFDKVGVNFSKVFGKFPIQFQRTSLELKKIQDPGHQNFGCNAYEKSFNSCNAF